jgi:uncharacterized protein YcfL
MRNFVFLAPIIAFTCSGCDVMNAMRCNQQAIEMSTQAICENVRAVEAANRQIDENTQHLSEINEKLKSMSDTEASGG